MLCLKWAAHIQFYSQRLLIKSRKQHKKIVLLTFFVSTYVLEYRYRWSVFFHEFYLVWCSSSSCYRAVKVTMVAREDLIKEKYSYCNNWIVIEIFMLHCVVLCYVYDDRHMIRLYMIKFKNEWKKKKEKKENKKKEKERSKKN